MSIESPGPPSLASQLLGDWTLRCCALFVLAAALMPADGLGVDLCWWHWATGTPCPGCGMTRCGSSLVRGDWSRAWAYHPFGPVFFPVAAGLGLLAVAPRAWREAVRARLGRWDVGLYRAFWMMGICFLIYGLGRCLAVWLGAGGFPPSLS